MSSFFVGQRVRVVRDFLNAPHTVGGEGRITSVNSRCPRYGKYGFRILIDRFPFVRFQPDELEPILPEGHRAGDYSLSQLLDRCKHGEGLPA